MSGTQDLVSCKHQLCKPPIRRTSTTTVHLGSKRAVSELLARIQVMSAHGNDEGSTCRSHRSRIHHCFVYCNRVSQNWTRSYFCDTAVVTNRRC
ncbi:hypothetical protein LSAT2_010043 [Lamellibrachia satsuma]|nr:hypothetical protein LSAT2_010043 [Lamellibrachia satsuma]